MIPSPQPAGQQAPRWQHALREAFTRPAELLEYLELDPGLPALAPALTRSFGMRIPRAFAARMRKGDPHDPLFLQVWPGADEGAEVPGFGIDAVGDLQRLREGGIVHKYDGRVLVMTTGACAVHCRYCFRRHFPYGDHIAARNHWHETRAVIEHGGPELHGGLCASVTARVNDDRLVKNALDLANARL